MAILPKIVIQTNADFTPAGKRRAKVAYANTRHARLQWYVSGRVYRTLAISAENIALSKRWVDRA
jgi:hypothetical protein